jgi:hypothetical protein
MPDDAIMVNTRDSAEAILAAHGSAAWSLNSGRASQAKWLVCARNDPERGERHGEAFLVGRISQIAPRPDGGEGRTRFVIGISEWAPVQRPNAWRGGQFPLTYGTLEEFIGVGADSLVFQPLPERTREFSYSEEPPPRRKAEAGITIPEAKRRLAIHLGVSEDQIAISINA